MASCRMSMTNPMQPSLNTMTRLVAFDKTRADMIRTNKILIGFSVEASRTLRSRGMVWPSKFSPTMVWHSSSWAKLSNAFKRFASTSISLVSVTASADFMRASRFASGSSTKSGWLDSCLETNANTWAPRPNKISSDSANSKLLNKGLTEWLSAKAFTLASSSTIAAKAVRICEITSMLASTVAVARVSHKAPNAPLSKRVLRTSLLVFFLMRPHNTLHCLKSLGFAFNALAASAICLAAFGGIVTISNHEHTRR
mmetsp:Transcript_54879/g.97706  ORF Transcript_54879/g.97706 Transcript_54879/m.97706 type:complete len:255 (-) Transcript_54879:82-846(-)